MDGKDEEPTGAEQVPDSPRERRLELIVTILLATAALMSAWCAYEASRYSGAENVGQTRATRLQVDATRATARAATLLQIDVTAFYEWVEATASGATDRATFFRERFRDDMKPAFEAWVAMEPLDNPDVPATPFELPDYRLAATVEANERQLDAQRAEAAADAAGLVAERYLLTVVLFATALFLLGIQSRIGVFELRAALVGIGATITVGTMLWVLTLPAEWPG